MKQRMHDLLQETIEYYSVNPDSRRAIGTWGGCQYYTPDGKMCAVGRLLNDPESYKGVVGSVEEILEGYEKEFVLKEEYVDIPTSFLDILQSLHDIDQYWNHEGLTASGTRFVNRIKDNINIGAYQ